ncbi:MAG: FAD-dependent 5-carboxymethylaminomethyl-2-thiouridine(34) oxidoreductase MnmC [Rhodoferax sp.]|nr:FAD-dependent 5-carboxymethylaminomethyl-2-thiouridine(34) oxidoreductase MnmC [Rhodoferax sp.]
MHGRGSTSHGKWKTTFLAAALTQRRVTYRQRLESGTVGLMEYSWHQLPCWRILDTDFGDGENFFRTWLAWRGDANAPRILHYVACCDSPVASSHLLSWTQGTPDLQALSQILAPQWLGLLPGFHRFLLDQGQVILTLCIGELSHLLRQQQFAADTLCFSGKALRTAAASHDGSVWLAKALARCSRRGTTLRCRHVDHADRPAWQGALTQCGFAVDMAQTTGCVEFAECLDGIFDPPWPIRYSRQPLPTAALPIESCVVVGAGLAGAAVASSLARRGWRVQVLDQADTPAAGASGLPVGLVVPHVSSDDCPLSRLSRAGVRLMLQQASACLVQNQHWAPSGVLERQVRGTPQLPKHWPEAGLEWSRTHQAKSTAQTCDAMIDSSLWHPQGAWIKPGELVRAWLNQPGVSFQAGARVDALRSCGVGWKLLDATGRVICEAKTVVLANACGAMTLLRKLAEHAPDLRTCLARLPASQGMRGLTSWGLHPEGRVEQRAFPDIPVNGSGSVIPGIPVKSGTAWFIGSSYQPETQPERPDTSNHWRNFEHLEQLLPKLANDLRAVFEGQQVLSWKGTRCVMADRLPVVGPLDGGNQPGLWICAGMGSRGLSFSVLCAELLAARMGAEPLPLESQLAKALEALRA